jgi:hypothetical protein
MEWLVLINSELTGAQSAGKLALTVLHKGDRSPSVLASFRKELIWTQNVSRKQA